MLPVKSWDPLTEFDVTGHAQQDIITLDIAVDDTMSVQMFQALGGFSGYGGDLTFRHQISGNNIGERASFHVLHNDP